MKGSNRRRYFTEAELGKLISAARKGRWGQRDATLILLMARHGLRVSEAVDLEWDQIDFTRAHLHVRRLKGGIASERRIGAALSVEWLDNDLAQPSWIEHNLLLVPLVGNEENVLLGNERRRHHRFRHTDEPIPTTETLRSAAISYTCHAH